MEEKISSSIELNAEYKTNEQKKSLEYKPKLTSLSAFKNRAIDEPINLDKLCHEISIGTNVNFKEEIYAIIPYKYDHAYTYIVYPDTIKFVELGTEAIVKKFLCHYPKMDFIGYKKTVQDFLGYKAKNIPLACEVFSLMPFRLSTKPNVDIWINPGRIKELKVTTNHEKTIVSLFNDFTFYLDRKGKSIYEQMYRAFLVHGVLRRYIGIMPTGAKMGLLEYLNISSSCVIRKAIKGLEFRDIPGYGKDFFEIFLRKHDDFVSERTEQRIFTSLNILE